MAVIVALPAPTPKARPLAFTVATAVLELLQTPAAVASKNVLVLPTQTDDRPVIEETTGRLLMITTFVTEAEQPLPFVTV